MAIHLALLRIPTYAADLVKRVHEETGYPLQLTIESGVGYDSALRMARSRRRYHEVAVVPEYQLYAPHFLVSGATKVLRLCAVPAEERVTPATRVGERLPEKEHRDLCRRLVHLEDADLERTSQLLFEGLVRQVTSMPLDLRVERELHETLTMHRPYQQAYLERQVQDIQGVFNPKLRPLWPSLIYNASTAMNLVLMDEVAELSGQRTCERPQMLEVRGIANDLRSMLRDTKEPGARGDRIVTTQWAARLGLSSWFDWRPWDDDVN